MSAVAAEFSPLFYDGREVPYGAAEEVSVGRRIIRSVAYGAGAAAGFIWSMTKVSASAIGDLVGVVVGSSVVGVVSLWRSFTPLMHGFIATAFTTALLFGTTSTLFQMALLGLFGASLAAIVGDIALTVGRGRRARRARKHQEAVDLAVAQAVASRREDFRMAKESNMTTIPANENVPAGTQVYMIWSERQFRAFNNRRRTVENNLSIAQEENDKAARSEWAGRLHILLRRWHLDERGARALRDEFKHQQIEMLGDSEAGRQYNWSQMLVHMKDEDELFTPMMEGTNTEITITMDGS